MMETALFTPDQPVARTTFADRYPVYQFLRDQLPVHNVSTEVVS